jgi:hypothetical protein
VNHAWTYRKLYANAIADPQRAAGIFPGNGSMREAARHAPAPAMVFTAGNACLGRPADGEGDAEILFSRAR